MIDLGRAPIRLISAAGEAVVFFADHADPNRFHYLRDRPRLQRTEDGPSLRLLRHRVDDTLRETLGGGILGLTVDLNVSVELRDELREALATRLGLSEPILVAVLAEAGTCRLQLLDRDSADDEESPFIARLLGEGQPALFGDNAATFQAVLAPSGADLVARALAADALPLGVVYTLEILGLRPALRARFTARWSEIYDFFERRMHGGALLLAVDVGPTFIELEQTDALTVEVDQLVPAAEEGAVYAEVVQHIRQAIIRRLFQPVLAHDTGVADAQDEEDGGDLRRVLLGAVGLFTVNFSLRDVSRETLRTATEDLQVARAARRVLAPQGMLTDLIAPTDDLSTLIIDLPPTAARAMHFDLGSAVDLDGAGVERLEVILTYGEVRHVRVLTALAPSAEVSVAFEPALGLAMTRQMIAHFAATEGSPAFSSVGPTTTDTARVIRLDPRPLAHDVELQVLARGIPFERYPSVLVDLRFDTAAGSGEVQTLSLSAQMLETRWRLRRSIESPPGMLFGRLRYIETDGQVLEHPWAPIKPGTWIVGDPAPDRLQIPILAAIDFGPRVARLIVEIERVDAPETRAAYVFDAERAQATWTVPLPAEAEAEARAWRYRVTEHSALNEIRDGDWVMGSGARLVVGGLQRIRPVQLMLLGPTLADLGWLALKVRFEHRAVDGRLLAEDERFITELGTPYDWAQPIDADSQPTWRWRLTGIAVDGTMPDGPWHDEATLMAIRVLTPGILP